MGYSAPSNLTTEQKGEIACLKVRLRAFELGALVCQPPIQARYDLVIDYEGRLYRAQVKYVDARTQHSQGAIFVDLRKRKRCYTRDEIDVVLVYVPQIDKICWLGPEVFHNKPAFHLRLLPTKNKQVKGCLMAVDYIW
jgi:hypothetical protein